MKGQRQRSCFNLKERKVGRRKGMVIGWAIEILEK
jgi:hypothetical protein